MSAGRRSWRAGIRPAILLSVWVVAFVLGVRDVLDRLAVPSWGNPRGEARSAELNAETRLRQAFVAPLPGLAGVQVSLASTASAEERHVTMRLSEIGAADSELGAEVVEIPAEASVTNVRLDLVPIAGSRGRTFCFSLEADAPPGEGATLAYSPDTLAEQTQTYLNDQPVGGTLQFQTYYSLRTREKIGLVLTSLAAGGTHLLHSKGPYVAVGLVYAGVLGLFLWQIAHSVLDEWQDTP